MDCAITSLLPASGAPTPPGTDAPAGSGAELAAIFASLVDGLSRNEADAAAAQRAPQEGAADRTADGSVAAGQGGLGGRSEGPDQ